MRRARPPPPNGPWWPTWKKAAAACCDGILRAPSIPVTDRMQDTFPEGLLASRDAGVLTLTIDRAADQNRLSPDLVGRLESLVQALREDRDTHVVVFTGAGTDVF